MGGASNQCRELDTHCSVTVLALIEILALTKMWCSVSCNSIFWQFLSNEYRSCIIVHTSVLIFLCPYRKP